MAKELIREIAVNFPNCPKLECDICFVQSYLFFPVSYNFQVFIYSR